jgi:hypothetical protein
MQLGHGLGRHHLADQARAGRHAHEQLVVAVEAHGRLAERRMSRAEHGEPQVAPRRSPQDESALAVGGALEQHQGVARAAVPEPSLHRHHGTRVIERQAPRVAELHLRAGDGSGRADHAHGTLLLRDGAPVETFGPGVLREALGQHRQPAGCGELDQQEPIAAGQPGDHHRAVRVPALGARPRVAGAGATTVVRHEAHQVGLDRRAA